MGDELPWAALFDAAEQARRRAHAPYSKFAVGVAIWCDDGSIITGCNVENASYGLTVCAERNAIAAMVLGGRTPRALAITVDTARVIPPCGACRQVLAEFANASLPVRSRARQLEQGWTLGELLPAAFDSGFLE